MGEILGLGLSHYPGFMYPDSDMAMRVKEIIKNPKDWPEPMQVEWGGRRRTNVC